MTWDSYFLIIENTPLIYIKQRIEEISDTCSIPDSTFCFGFEKLSMYNFTNLWVRNDFVKPIKLLSIPRSFVYCTNCTQET